MTDELTLTFKSREVENGIVWYRADCSCGGVVTFTFPEGWKGIFYKVLAPCSLGNHSFQLEHDPAYTKSADGTRLEYNP